MIDEGPSVDGTESTGRRVAIVADGHNKKVARTSTI